MIVSLCSLCLVIVLPEQFEMSVACRLVACLCQCVPYTPTVHFLKLDPELLEVTQNLHNLFKSKAVSGPRRSESWCLVIAFARSCDGVASTIPSGSLSLSMHTPYPYCTRSDPDAARAI